MAIAAINIMLRDMTNGKQQRNDQKEAEQAISGV